MKMQTSEWQYEREYKLMVCFCRTSLLCDAKSCLLTECDSLVDIGYT